MSIEQSENLPDAPAETLEIADLEDENESLYRWLILAVFIIWIISFLMF